MLAAGAVVLPAAVTATSGDGNLGETPIGYGDHSGGPNDDLTPQSPTAALPGATFPGATFPGVTTTVEGASDTDDSDCRAHLHLFSLSFILIASKFPRQYCTVNLLIQPSSRRKHSNWLFRNVSKSFGEVPKPHQTAPILLQGSRVCPGQVPRSLHCAVTVPEIRGPSVQLTMCGFWATSLGQLS